jgi:hypothetical protein
MPGSIEPMGRNSFGGISSFWFAPSVDQDRPYIWRSFCEFVQIYIDQATALGYDLDVLRVF